MSIASRDTTSKKRLVLEITRMTIHNGPGIRTLISFKGCPLRCLWCSTPESQKTDPEISLRESQCPKCGRCVPVCPANAISLVNGLLKIDRDVCTNCGQCVDVCNTGALTLLGRPMTVEALVECAKNDAVFYKHSNGGVTISGGEPLLEADFNYELLQGLKRNRINVGVDTSGHIPWQNIDPLLPYVDFFLWDIKHMDPEVHGKLTGVSNELILSNLFAVSRTKVPVYLRVPLIPGCNDSEENIRATCETAKALSSILEVHLLPFHHLGKTRYESLNRDYPVADLPVIPHHVLYKTKGIVESYGLKCIIGG